MTTHRRSLIAALSAASLVFAAAAVAQESRDTTPLEPIVVTATRTPTSTGSLANGVTVLEGDALRAAGLTTLGEALRGVPSLAEAQSGSFGGVTSLFLRGAQSNDVRVLVDGVPLNEAGGSVDLSALPLEEVERIEVVRGPVSVLYGSDAAAGVIQVFTRRGGTGLHGEAEVVTGSYGAREARGDAGGGSPALSWSLGGATTRTDGVYAFNSGYRTSSLAGRLALAPDARTDVSLSLRFGDRRFAYPTDGSGAPVDSNQHQLDRTVVASLEAGRRLSRGVEARLAFGLRSSRDSTDDRPDGPGDTLGIYASWSGARTSRRSADARVNLTAPDGSVGTLGASVDREAERSANGYLSDFGPGSGQVDVARTNRAAYAQVVSAWHGPVAIQGGARLESNAAFGSFFTWRAGAVVRLAQRTRARLAAGTAFTEPTFIENFATGWATGNPDLRPERTRSWEAGLEQSLAGGRLTLAATWFDQRFRDLIQYTFLSAAGQPNFFNVAGANAGGLELALRFAPQRAVDVDAQYTWLRTSAADSGYDGSSFAPGRRLLRRPTSSGSVSVALRPGMRWRGGMRVLATGSRDDLDFSVFPARRVRLAPYGRLDLWGDVALVRGGPVALELTARVDNLTGANTSEVYGFRSPGRVLHLGLRVEAAR